MAIEVSKTLFTTHAAELLSQVEATGKPLVITDNGRPTLEVRRYCSDQRAPLERLRGSVINLQDPFQPVDPDSWEGR